ncbi:Ig-like domain-containing protein [Planotetraspora sp. A-T 1434]|uniref:L,D-transpeptidase n=1 Tax=Planotetraspora sp. A-T 1434 TaxID=2979219 RepID=UPI0021BE461C|nr:Ig-like domain-containing protein [Planotetraspora sp. A-T 1434]MCT9930089.1 Ig-like domain-containing protein [Planotetraspora sp. A-T 1434]
MRAGAGALALLMAAGCSATSTDQDGDGPAAKAAITITPMDGARELPPELPITVGAVGGALKSVTVRAGGQPVTGVYSADHTQWRSDRPMAPGVSYSVTAVAAAPGGGTVQRSSAFTTKRGTTTFGIETLLPSKQDTGLTVGVGMPIMLTFDKKITDRVSVERNLFVQASKPVEGAWHWYDDRNVVFRPKEYWPPYTTVRFTARLSGVRGAEGMYGKQDYVRDFTIGRSQISQADTQTHYMKIRRDGKVIQNFPISAGMGGVWRHYTTSGVHLAMSREDVTVMTSPDAGPGDAGYYQTTVYDTVRISNSGEYVHGAPWSVGDQGNSNVSHGCINVSPSNAKWFLKNTLIGDPVIVRGTPRKLEPTNGWGHWQESWGDWLKWSRLRGDISQPL